MTIPRSQQVCLDVTPYYHCVSRCVRCTFLCGYDELTQQSYEHRRSWIEARIKELSAVYCIDVCAYAVMSNHYHIVIHVNKEKAKTLTESEVIERWGCLHSKPLLIQHYQSGNLKNRAELKNVQKIVTQWRERLYSLSWFMRDLNFDIALRANREEQCKGHFWESRYKSQALLDEKALLAAMAYTDLNPIRAGTATTPETSKYTSIKDRLDALKNNQMTAPCLYPFIGNPTNEMASGIPFRLMDYVELVDWSGRELRQGKANIDNKLPSILDRLSMTQQEWLQVCTSLERQGALLVGSKKSFLSVMPKMKRQRIRGYCLN